MKEVIAALHEALQRNEPVALATVVDVQGTSPAQLGFKLLVWLDGRCRGQRRRRQVGAAGARGGRGGPARRPFAAVSRRAA